MAAQNSNFASKFHPRLRFSAPNFAFLDKHLLTKTTQFSDNFTTTKTSRWSVASPVSLPRTTPLTLTVTPQVLSCTLLRQWRADSWRSTVWHSTEVAEQVEQLIEEPKGWCQLIIDCTVWTWSAPGLHSMTHWTLYCSTAASLGQRRTTHGHHTAQPVPQGQEDFTTQSVLMVQRRTLPRQADLTTLPVTLFQCLPQIQTDHIILVQRLTKSQEDFTTVFPVPLVQRRTSLGHPTTLEAASRAAAVAFSTPSTNCTRCRRPTSAVPTDGQQTIILMPRKYSLALKHWRRNVGTYTAATIPLLPQLQSLELGAAVSGKC